MTTIVLPLKVKLAHMRNSLLDLKHKQLAIQPKNKRRSETETPSPISKSQILQDSSNDLKRENEELRYQVAERDEEINSLQSELTLLREELDNLKKAARRSILKKKVSIQEPKEVIFYDVDYD